MRKLIVSNFVLKDSDPVQARREGNAMLEMNTPDLAATRS